MPWGNRTGPFGTFRNCLPVDTAGQPMPYGRPYGRKFFGRGFRGGFGRGFRWRFLAAGQPMQWQAQPVQPMQTPLAEPVQPAQTEPTNENKIEEINFLKEELEAIKRRIDQLKTEVK